MYRVNLLVVHREWKYQMEHEIEFGVMLGNIRGSWGCTWDVENGKESGNYSLGCLGIGG